MISRCLVPADATISVEAGKADDAKPHVEVLIPRRLVPAGAHTKPIQIPPEPAGAGRARNFLVAKRLVPVNARIGPFASDAGNAGRQTAAEDVFKDAILPEASIGHRRSPGEWLVSIGVHAVLVATLVIVPFFYTRTLDLGRLQVTFLTAPPMPAAAPPPPPPAAVAARPVAQVRRIVPGKLTMPIAIPKAIQVPTKPETEPYPSEPEGIPGGIYGGIPGGITGGVIGGVIGGELASAEIPAPPPVTAKTGKPLHVGGDVKPPQLLFRVEPKYPALALQARVEGDVQIDAVIDEKGNVVEMHAVAGPGLLIQAALKAVSQWKYQPTYLNGEPYAIELRVHVTFQLAQGM